MAKKAHARGACSVKYYKKTFVLAVDAVSEEQIARAVLRAHEGAVVMAVKRLSDEVSFTKALRGHSDTLLVGEGVEILEQAMTSA